MTLDYATQFQYAESQSDYRDRVVSVMFSAAVSAFSAPPISGTGAGGATQQQRVALANTLIKTPDFALRTFAWVVIRHPSLTTVDDLTDVKINAIMTQNVFDIAAAQLMPSGP